MTGCELFNCDDYINGLCHYDSDTCKFNEELKQMKILTFEQWVKKVKGTSHWVWLTEDINQGWIGDVSEYHDYVVRAAKKQLKQ